MADAGSLGRLSFRDLPALPSLEFATIENKAKEMMTCSKGGSSRVTVEGRVPEKRGLDTWLEMWLVRVGFLRSAPFPLTCQPSWALVRT